MILGWEGSLGVALDAVERVGAVHTGMSSTDATCLRPAPADAASANTAAIQQQQQ